MTIHPNHEWVASYAEFEAVLICTNQLAQWDRDASIRAYQTYGWNDASTGGDEHYFHHEESGIVIRHDGDVVAIEFAAQPLKAALFDLFKVLHALGWRQAEVLHPAETMDLLLEDIGKAIPAALDLDVRPAQAVLVTGRARGGVELLEQGRALMQHAVMDEFNDLALGHLQELGAMANFDEPVPGDDLSRDDVPISWDRMPDEPLQSDPGGRLAVAGSAAHSPFLDDDPPVVSLGSLDALAQPAMEPPSAAAREAHPVEPLVPVAVPVARLSPDAAVGPANADADADTDVTCDRMPMRPSILQPTDSPPPAPQPSLAAHANVIQLGRCAIAFDTPMTPLLPDAIAGLASTLGARVVDHLWPGLCNQEHRWDVLGEMDSDHPTMAEVLVAELGVCERGRGLLTAVIQGLVASRRCGQLRDVLVACVQGMNGLDELPLASAHHPLKGAFRATFSDSWAKALQDYAGLLAGLDGYGFTDIRSGEADELAEGVKCFTLRQLRLEAAPRLLVVHLDPTDGKSVENIVGLLRRLAIRYSTSMRFDRLRDAAHDAAVAEQERQRFKAFADAAERIGPVVKMLREAGVNV